MIAGVLIVSACGSTDATSAEPTSPTPTSASTPQPTTTAAPLTIAPTTEPATTAPVTTAEPPPPTAPTQLPPEIEALGYPVSEDYIVETVIADIGSGTGGLALDPDGNIYLADFGGFEDGTGDKVFKITPELVVEEFATSDLMRKNTATVFGPDGTLYQSSYGSGNLFAIGTDGAVTLIAEGMKGPTGIVPRADGTILVQAYDRRVIYEVLPDGSFEDWSKGPGFNGPNGMIAGPDGTLYAVNHRDGRLLTIDDDGVSTELHRFPKATAHVAYLDGGLFVTSRSGYVVFRYDLETAEVVIIAGNGEAGNVDGRGVGASFGRPNAITVGPDGALYTNHGGGDSNTPVTIRRISYRPT